jgi:lipopolysaccharide export system permease protein
LRLLQRTFTLAHQMRLLARYLLRECLVALGFCFSAFLILWVTLDLITELDDIQENELGLFDVAEYYFFRIPEFLPVALPVALLLALLYSVTTHARHNEITAIRAAGVSLWRLCLPYLGIGVVGAITLFVLNEFVAPRSLELAERVISGRAPRDSERQQVKSLAFKNEREDRVWHIGVYDERTAEMFQPHVDSPLPDGSRHLLFADRAVRTNGVWTFYNVRQYRDSKVPNAVPIKLPEKDVLAIPELTETPEEIRSEINVSERFQRQSRTRRADIPIGEILNYLRLHPDPRASIRSWLYTKLHGRFAVPFTCVVVVLLAVPFAAAPGRRNVFVGVAASILIFFIYYILQQVGLAFGEAGRVPAWFGAWFPNLLFGIAGCWMMLRVR